MSDTQQERQQEIADLQEMIQSIRVGMFTTVGSDGRLRSRPMLTAKTGFDGDLWFFTRISHGLATDVKPGAQVHIAYSCPQSDQYISVEGLATVVQDRQKQEVLWDDDLKPWFPNGVETEDMALIKVTVERAEMWDAHTSKFGEAVGYLKSMLTGQEEASYEHSTLFWDQDASHSTEKEREEVSAR